MNKTFYMPSAGQIAGVAGSPGNPMAITEEQAKQCCCGCQWKVEYEACWPSEASSAPVWREASASWVAAEKPEGTVSGGQCNPTIWGTIHDCNISPKPSKPTPAAAPSSGCGFFRGVGQTLGPTQIVSAVTGNRCSHQLNQSNPNANPCFPYSVSIRQMAENVFSARGITVNSFNCPPPGDCEGCVSSFPDHADLSGSPSSTVFWMEDCIGICVDGSLQYDDYRISANVQQCFFTAKVIC